MNNELFNYWYLVDDEAEVGVSSFNINFGPQHPAAHGVLRIVLQMKGEFIERSDLHIGLLHSGTENLLEQRPYSLGLPYFDRLDYTSILIQEHAYCLALEGLLGNNNYLINFTSVSLIFDELTRILNHLIALSTHSMDVGTMAIFFWAFEESERIMEFYERVAGASMHAAFYRPNELNINYISLGLLKDIIFFCSDLFNRLGQIESNLNATSIWRTRLCEVGVISPEYIIMWGITGPVGSSAGLNYDVSLNYAETYGSYYSLSLRSFVGERGDCYDRFLISMSEMAESLHIILQLISNWVVLWCGDNEVLSLMRTREYQSFQNHYNSTWCLTMEELVAHYNVCSEGYTVPRGTIYSSVESANGEFGIFLVADGSTHPYSCRVRSPAYFHSQLFNLMCQGHYFADLVTIIGSQDIVMGEVDS